MLSLLPQPFRKVLESIPGTIVAGTVLLVLLVLIILATR